MSDAGLMISAVTLAAIILAISAAGSISSRDALLGSAVAVIGSLAAWVIINGILWFASKVVA